MPPPAHLLLLRLVWHLQHAAGVFLKEAPWCFHWGSETVTGSVSACELPAI